MFRIIATTLSLLITASGSDPAVVVTEEASTPSVPAAYPAERYAKVKARSPFGTPVKKVEKVVPPDTLSEDYALAGISATGDVSTVFLINRLTGEYLDLQSDGGEKMGIRIIEVSDNPDLRKASVEIGRGETQARITYDTTALLAAPTPPVAAPNTAQPGLASHQQGSRSVAGGNPPNILPPGAPPSSAPPLPAFLSGGPPQTSAQGGGSPPGTVQPSPATRRRLVLPSIPGTPRS